MRRYIVLNAKSGTTEHLYHSLGEALAAAVRLIDEGTDANLIDAQGSGAIVVGRFDLLEAEGYLHRSLGSESFDQPLPVEKILQAARRRRKDQPKIYHWDTSSSDIR